MSDNPPSFEETFGRLQSAIESLEQGGLTLEEALKIFEQGMALASVCQKTLDQAELRLTRLLQEHAPVSESIPPEAD